jgi:hypothetical protein
VVRVTIERVYVGQRSISPEYQPHMEVAYRSTPFSADVEPLLRFSPGADHAGRPVSGNKGTVLFSESLMKVPATIQQGFNRI